MDVEKVEAHWLKSAEEDWRVVRDLFSLGHNSQCLFFCHLVIEKILKALVVIRTQTHAPTIHHLLRLAEIAGLKIDEERAGQLNTLTTFNIRARYDDAKTSFHQTATQEYTETWFQVTEELYQWLRERF